MYRGFTHTFMKVTSRPSFTLLRCGVHSLGVLLFSKKGPKEGERVARGHFHERVGESPVHWLPPGVGFTQKPFSVSENGPIENFLRSNSIFI